MCQLNNHQKFYDFIDKNGVAYLFKSILSREHNDLILSGLCRHLAKFNHSEQALIRFLTTVWLGEPLLRLSIFTVITEMDPEHQKIFINWLQDPFWP